MSGTLGKSSLRFGVILLVAFFVMLGVTFYAWRNNAYTRVEAPLAAALIVTLVIYIWFWIWAIIAIGNIAENKGYSKAGFIIFAIFLPLIALIVALVVQPSQTKQIAVTSAQLVKCPMCAELVQPDAKKCKHCGSDIASAS